MKPTISSILLVDDDAATNFLHSKIIQRSGLVENIVIKETGLKAIEYLKSIESGGHPCPSLILLDINMPAMNGWEFLEAYNKLEASQTGKAIIIMLTTSMNPDDEVKARQLGLIDDFQHKPMTIEMFEMIVKKYLMVEV